MKENSRVELYLLRIMRKLVKKECFCAIGRPKCLKCVLTEKLDIAEKLPSFLELWDDCIEIWTEACKSQRHVYRDEDCVWKLAELYEYSDFPQLVSATGDGILCKLLETSIHSNPSQEIREWLISISMRRASPAVKESATWLAGKWDIEWQI